MSFFFKEEFFNYSFTKTNMKKMYLLLNARDFKLSTIRIFLHIFLFAREPFHIAFNPWTTPKCCWLRQWTGQQQEGSQTLLLSQVLSLLIHKSRIPFTEVSKVLQDLMSQFSVISQSALKYYLLNSKMHVNPWQPCIYHNPLELGFSALFKNTLEFNHI